MGATFDEGSAPRERRTAEAAHDAVWALEGDMQAEARRSLREISADFEQARALLREAFKLSPEEALPLVKLAQVAQETQQQAERELAALHRVPAPELEPEPEPELEPEIVRALIVHCAGVLAALPEESIVEVLRGGLKRVQHPDGRVSLRVRGRAVKFAPLAELLRLDAAPPEDPHAVILRNGDRAFAILVDEIYGVEDVTLEEGPRSRLVSGAALLSDGAALLWMDVPGLAAAIGPRAATASARPQKESPRVPLLVFRGAGGAVEAAPLSLIDRIEPLEEAVAMDGMWMAAQSRGLIPTLDSQGNSVKAEEGAELLVFARGDEEVALVAAEIIETAECSADAPLQHAGAAGALNLNGRAAALVELNALWRAFDPPEAPPQARGVHDETFEQEGYAPRILVVGRAFARLAVCLPACDLTFDGEPEAALTRHDDGERFDLIVVDAESVTGQRVMRVLSRAAAWRDIPILALPRDGDQSELVAAIEDALTAN